MNRAIFRVSGLGIIVTTLVIGTISCNPQKEEIKEQDLLIKTAETSWEENQTTEGCKLYADYPTDSISALSQNIREWINETLGGTYSGNLNDGQKLIEYYGKQKAEQIARDIAEVGENTAMSKSAYYVQLRNKFETGKFVTYTSEIYEYAGGAHGGESEFGAVFRKTDGRKFGWDMFTVDGQAKLRDIIKNELKEKYFKAKSDEEFYSMLLVEDARYLFPLPVTAPICLRSGIKFIYQQYEIAPYAAGKPFCIIPYNKLENMYTVTVKPLIESTTDSIATVVFFSRYKLD